MFTPIRLAVNLFQLNCFFHLLNILKIIQFIKYYFFVTNKKLFLPTPAGRQPNRGGRGARVWHHMQQPHHQPPPPPVDRADFGEWRNIFAIQYPSFSLSNKFLSSERLLTITVFSKWRDNPTTSPPRPQWTEQTLVSFEIFIQFELKHFMLETFYSL